MKLYHSWYILARGVFFTLKFPLRHRNNQHERNDTMASIRKRGKNYQITVSNGRRSDGSQIIETTTFTPDPNKTKKQNETALQLYALQFEEQVKNGSYLDGEKITFQEFAEKYLKEYAANHLGPNTLAQYEALLKIHIYPAIGNIKLAKVQPRNLNTLYNQLLKERKDGRPGGYSPKTIRHIHNTISAIYTVAIKWNIVMNNPCERIEPPKSSEGKTLKHFTLEQATAFLECLNSNIPITIQAHDRIDDTGKAYHVNSYTENKQIPTQFKVFFNLALFCGMRRGELIALQWNDIDFNNNTISITKSTVIVKKKVITKQPKTESSNRIISVPNSVMLLLKRYRKEYLEYRLSLGDAWEGDNYLFIQWNGQQMYPSTPYGMFKKIIRWYNTSADEAHQLPLIPLHGLRHTSATLLISQNVDVRTVAGRLGHSQTSTTTDIYSHFLKRADEVASDKLENLLNTEKKSEKIAR